MSLTEMPLDSNFPLAYRNSKTDYLSFELNLLYFKLIKATPDLFSGVEIPII